MRSVFLAPHNDDEALFGSFTLLRHKPHVIICHYSGNDRAAETHDAMRILGCTWDQWQHTPTDWKDIEADIARLAKTHDHCYAPALEPGGNDQHNHIARSAERSFKNVTHYLTYTESGRSTNGNHVPYELAWIGLKLRALACYPSQYAHPSHAPHFVRGLEEFYA